MPDLLTLASVVIFLSTLVIIALTRALVKKNDECLRWKHNHSQALKEQSYWIDFISELPDVKQDEEYPPIPPHPEKLARELMFRVREDLKRKMVR